MRQDVNQNMIVAKINTDKINYSAYAEQYNCDHRTIKRYYKAETSTLTAKRKPRIIKKKTDDYAAIIEEKFVNYHCSAMAIYKFLCKHHGYEGSYGTIRNYCRKLDEQKQKEAIVRFETMPGLQCQIDWKEELSLETSDGETPLARLEREMKNITDVPNIDVLSAYFLQKPLVCKCKVLCPNRVYRQNRVKGK